MRMVGLKVLKGLLNKIRGLFITRQNFIGDINIFHKFHHQDRDESAIYHVINKKVRLYQFLNKLVLIKV